MFDCGNYFSFEYNEETDSLQLTATTFIPKHSQVFVLDHIWTTEDQTLRQNLMENEKLLSRLETLFNIPPETTETPTSDAKEGEPEVEEEGPSEEEKKQKEEEAISSLPTDPKPTISNWTTAPSLLFRSSSYQKDTSP